MADLVTSLVAWFTQWADDVLAIPPRFVDTDVDPQVRRLSIKHLREDVERLDTIMKREFNRSIPKAKKAHKPTLTPAQKEEVLLTRLVQSYDPPGELRPEGPRHNNDSADISEIRIAPTREELLCPVNPFLPAAVSGAPHPLEENSMEQHLIRSLNRLPGLRP